MPPVTQPAADPAVSVARAEVAPAAMVNGVQVTSEFPKTSSQATVRSAEGAVETVTVTYMLWPAMIFQSDVVAAER